MTPWTAACQASLSITNSRSLLKPMPIESVMPSSHLTLCRPLLLLPSIFPSIRVFSYESVLCIRWPKYWSFSFSVSPSNDCSFSRNCILNVEFFSFSCAGDTWNDTLQMLGSSHRSRKVTTDMFTVILRRQSFCFPLQCCIQFHALFKRDFVLEEFAPL